MSVYRISLWRRSLAVALLCLPGLAHAESIYSVGNSLTNDIVPDGLVALAADSGTALEAGFHIRAGRSLTFIVASPADVTYSRGGNWDVALASRAWDAVTMQPYGGLESTLGSEAQAILQLIRTSKPGTRFYVYAAWPSLLETGGDYRAYWLQPVSAQSVQPTVLAAGYFNHLLRHVREQLPRSTTLELIPVGAVFAQLDQEFRAGSWAGLGDATALYRDADHMGDVGRFAAAATVYATVFKRKPRIGSRLHIYQQGLGSVPLTAELAGRIEDVVWKVVVESGATAAPATAPVKEAGGSGAFDGEWLAALALLGCWRARRRAAEGFTNRAGPAGNR